MRAGARATNNLSSLPSNSGPFPRTSTMQSGPVSSCASAAAPLAPSPTRCKHSIRSAPPARGATCMCSRASDLRAHARCACLRTRIRNQHKKKAQQSASVLSRSLHEGVTAHTDAADPRRAPGARGGLRPLEESDAAAAAAAAAPPHAASKPAVSGTIPLPGCCRGDVGGEHGGGGDGSAACTAPSTAQASSGSSTSLTHTHGAPRAAMAAARAVLAGRHPARPAAVAAAAAGLYSSAMPSASAARTDPGSRSTSRSRRALHWRSAGPPAASDAGALDSDLVLPAGSDDVRAVSSSRASGTRVAARPASLLGGGDAGSGGVGAIRCGPQASREDPTPAAGAGDLRRPVQAVMPGDPVALAGRGREAAFGTFAAPFVEEAVEGGSRADPAPNGCTEEAAELADAADAADAAEGVRDLPRPPPARPNARSRLRTSTARRASSPRSGGSSPSSGSGSAVTVASVFDAARAVLLYPPARADEPETALPAALLEEFAGDRSADGFRDWRPAPAGQPLGLEACDVLTLTAGSGRSGGASSVRGTARDGWSELGS